MTVQSAMPDPRGGGDTSRRDAFRYAPRGAVFALIAIVGVGLTAIAFVAYNIAGAREQPEAGWVMLGGLFIILFALGIGWLAMRRPVLLVVGPAGLDLPASLAQPVPWDAIRRIRCTRWRVSLLTTLRMLRVELADGMRLSYKRRLWTIPKVDSWVARRYGLNVPLQNLDADEEVVIASVERFRPVTKDA